MSNITKCDICGVIDDHNIRDFDTFRVPIKRRIFTLGNGWVWKDIDVCPDCLKLLRDKAKEVQKNENNS